MKKWYKGIQIFSEENDTTAEVVKVTEEKKAEVLQMTQEDLDKIINDRVAREKTKYEKKINETTQEFEKRMKLSTMTAKEQADFELNSAKEQAELYKTELENYKVEKIKMELSAKHQLPAESLKLITGKTEEEIENQIALIKQVTENLWKSKAGGTPKEMNVTKNNDEHEKLKSYIKRF